MDYEKEYESALERARAINEGKVDLAQGETTCEFIFPELKDGEDEKVRKAIVKLVSDMFGGYPFEKYGITKKETLVWLENQGAQKPTEEPEWSVEDEKAINDLMWIIEAYRKDAFNETHYKMADNAERWLTSLKPRNQQKPVDEIESGDKHLVLKEGEYYLCIRDFCAADGCPYTKKGRIYKSHTFGYIIGEEGWGLAWPSGAEYYFKPLNDEDWIVCEYGNVIGKPLQYKEFKKALSKFDIYKLRKIGLYPSFRLFDADKDNQLPESKV